MSDLTESKSLSTRSLLLTSTGVAVVCGLIEWCMIRGLGFEMLQARVCRVILSISILYGFFGLVLGAISTVLFLAKKSSVSGNTRAINEGPNNESKFMFFKRYPQ